MTAANSSDSVQRSAIVLHGLGASGADLAPLAGALWTSKEVRWLFPDAPARPITINGGVSMRGWYDISSSRLTDREDEAGIRASALIVDELISAELARGVAPANIVLAGFSQGGAMALHVGLRQQQPLKAIVALSCYLPLAKQTIAELGAGASHVPIFLATGTSDQIIPTTATTATATTLKAMGCSVVFRSYPMGHAIVPDEISDVATFLAAPNSAL